ncbi:MAG TPA: hypothetical protein VII29_12765 [Terriglobales bacterium]|jgi:hypothetical protein
MAKTAVGLFKNQGSVDSVVSALEADGFLSKDIRVLREAVDMPSSGVMSTPRVDFEVELTRDLRAMGATDAHAAAYVAGVRRGGILVFATAPGDKADAAVGIMNAHGAAGADEVSGQESSLPGAGQSDAAPVRETSVLAGAAPSFGSGARLFVW